MSLFIIIIKTLLSNSLLIFLRREFIKRVSYIKINIFINKYCFINIFIKIK